MKNNLNLVPLITNKDNTSSKIISFPSCKFINTDLEYTLTLGSKKVKRVRPSRKYKEGPEQAVPRLKQPEQSLSVLWLSTGLAPS